MDIIRDTVSAVIRLVVKAEPQNAHIQLTILTRALAVAAKTVGAPKEIVTENFERAYDEVIVSKQ